MTTISTTEPYTVSASAPGAWSCRLQVPLDSFDAVCGALETAARLRSLPITAAVRGGDGDVAELTLVRDPSVLFGTPEIHLYEELVDLFTTGIGWRRYPPAPAPAITIPLGLRRGYDKNALVYPADETRRRLVDDVPGVRAWPVRLCSVRILHDGEPQWHRESGLLVHSDDATLLPRLAQFAAALGQDRFVVTSAGAGATTAYRRRAPADG
ncbi:hypothetical protein [Amycolatopsis sp. TNS106]|uniref:hypothetical protein n=1 Tax=Amycolatopsis sp. TNS106 TaxID=2861750 RepID=UPI001C597F25|nr:hypothetical protein [Amycolatopsis sp. TNS106]QXV63542.1 hypothetical protein CVV72_41000 [Amycolatopsis sp. TNS106]